jgi:hypothetical protein
VKKWQKTEENYTVVLTIKSQKRRKEFSKRYGAFSSVAIAINIY